METTKKWYLSKAFWASTIGVLGAIYDALVPAMQANFGVALPFVPAWVFGILAGLGLYGRMTATAKLTK